MNNNANPGVGPSGSGSSNGSTSRSGRTRRSRANTASRPRENRSVSGKVREGVKKKLGFYTDMMSQLDMLVFAELCVLYYMDCSFFRFFIRAAAQSFFLSPKAEDFAIALDARKPHVFAIFAPNFLCILAHSLGTLPIASEANRGYLHGGVIIDFVGQTAPTSKLGLVALDLVVLVVQCLMLAMHTEREKMRRLVVPIRTVATTTATTPAAAAANAAVVRAGGTPSPPPPAANPPAAATLQDHDAEERGVRTRPRSGTGANAAGPSSSSNSENAPPSEDERLHNIDLAGPTGAASPEEAAEHELEALSSGSNIGDFYIIHAIRQAMQEKQGDSAAQSLQSIGYAVTLARLAAERRTRARAAVAARPAQ
ncbi:hypothetical protein SBRCBS47491_000581 [Sporothrix bragantina]|uniref:DUF1746 domain-containing protein n=1 Tax=Sporothrix bragantina TaxID=671064 RepID=A0ABP0ARI8_9PEZI